MAVTRKVHGHCRSVERRTASPARKSSSSKVGIRQRILGNGVEFSNGVEPVFRKFTFPRNSFASATDGEFYLVIETCPSLPHRALLLRSPKPCVSSFLNSRLLSSGEGRCFPSSSLISEEHDAGAVLSPRKSGKGREFPTYQFSHFTSVKGFQQRNILFRNTSGGTLLGGILLFIRLFPLLSFRGMFRQLSRRF